MTAPGNFTIQVGWDSEPGGGETLAGEVSKTLFDPEESPPDLPTLLMTGEKDPVVVPRLAEGLDAIWVSSKRLLRINPATREFREVLQIPLPAGGYYQPPPHTATCALMWGWA